MKVQAVAAQRGSMSYGVVHLQSKDRRARPACSLYPFRFPVGLTVEPEDIECKKCKLIIEQEKPS